MKAVLAISIPNSGSAWHLTTPEEWLLIDDGLVDIELELISMVLSLWNQQAGRTTFLHVVA